MKQKAEMKSQRWTPALIFIFDNLHLSRTFLSFKEKKGIKKKMMKASEAVASQFKINAD